jgi:hypothetical protein
VTILTLATLEAKGACADQRDLFRSMFGASVDVTRELCISVASQFSFTWAAQRLLKATARADFSCARAAALVDFKDATTAARDDYNRATTAAWDDYDRATAPARDDYDRAVAAAWADYARIRAAAFADAYNSQESQT